MSTDQKLGTRLLAQGGLSGAESYRREVNSMIEKMERSFKREKRTTTWMHYFLTSLSTVFLSVGALRREDNPQEGIWFAVLGCFVLLFNGLFVLRYYLNRNRLEILKELKEIQIHLLALKRSKD